MIVDIHIAKKRLPTTAKIKEVIIVVEAEDESAARLEVFKLLHDLHLEIVDKAESA